MLEGPLACFERRIIQFSGLDEEIFVNTTDNPGDQDTISAEEMNTLPAKTSGALQACCLKNPGERLQNNNIPGIRQY